MKWESRILPNINELLKIKCHTRVLTLLRRFPKCGRCASGEGRNFLGKFYNRIKLVVIMELSEIDCLISCIPTRNTTLAATRMLGPIKSFLRLLSCSVTYRHFELPCQPAVSQQSAFLATPYTFVTRPFLCALLQHYGVQNQF